MDLTYMPGELDYKTEKKESDSNIKREHDSVDDFEHLDPELSPVDVDRKDFSPPEGLEKIDNNPEHSSKKAKELLFENTPSDNVSPSNHPLEISANIKDSAIAMVKESQDIKPELHLSHQETPSVLDFGVGENVPPTQFRENIPVGGDSMLIVNNDFISAEKGSKTVKTDYDSDLLGLENKANTIQELVDSKSPTTIKENVKEELEDHTKPMKEDDALSQYDIKSDKKVASKNDNLVTEGVDDNTYFYKPNDLPGNQLGSLMDESKNKPFEENEPLEVDSVKDESKYPSELTDLQSKVDTDKSDDSGSEHEQRDLQKDQENELLPEKITHVSKDEPADESVFKPKICIYPIKPKELPETKISDLDDIIGPEDVFKRIGLDAWFTPERLHPIVEALVYWRDPKKSGVVFGGVMAILLSLCYMSLISVVAYSSLLALTGTICFRIYKNILQAVQKTSEGHPFKEFLDIELSLPQDKVREMVDTAVVHINAAIVELRRLFLVEDLIDSIKFGVCLWCLTYVGAIFNGMTIVILAFVALFSVPKIYENNKASIDTYIDMGRSKVAEITSKVKAAVPIGKKEPEKDKEQ